MLQLSKLWQKGSMPCCSLIAGDVEAIYSAVTAFIGGILPLNSPDVFIIEPKERSIGVGQIRELNRWSNETVELYKFAVIKEADKMTFAAANACLKTLEEPSKSRFFFLIANNPKALPKTLVSRCQIMWHKDDTDSTECRKLISAVLTGNKEALTQLLSQQGSAIDLLLAHWVKRKVTNQQAAVLSNPLNLLDCISRLQSLARHYSSLALDSRHISAILLHELLCSL